VGVVRPEREKKESDPIKPLRDNYPNGKLGKAKYDVDLSSYQASFKAWKKRDTARKGRNTALAKSASVQTAMSFFPSIDMRRNPKCKVPHDGKAEALLLAVYASRVGAKAAL
jgi:hypothetical protein